ncbi:LysR family transcriptional regulator [Comamonas sp. GB3 AK4-5]|uniref:LysR family transcriptional regulator n=1 Tax=Comamonas sp. GB3 AK4-5 TaxID=3231487 RepID=UPI00351ECFCA
MNLQQLETFVHVAENRSFSKAANLLDIAQPALSRQVRALETELRETLLIRTGRGVELTDAGQRLLVHAHGILQQVAWAKDDLQSQRGEPAGQIVVGLPPSLARRLTLPLIDIFSKQMPKAHLVIAEGFSVSIAEWLASGRMDLGLVYSPEAHPDLEVTPVLGERMHLIAPASALPRNTEVAFAELPRFPLIMPPRGQIFRKLMEAQAALLQVKLNVVWEVSSVPAILDLVRGGYGYAALTDSALHTHAPEQGLSQHPIRKPHVDCTLCLMQSVKKRSTPLMQRSREVLQRISREVCGRSGSAP